MALVLRSPIRFLIALIATPLIGAIGYSQHIIVQAEGEKQIVLAKSDIESLTHVTVSVYQSEASASYEGVTVRSVFGQSRSPIRGIAERQAAGLLSSWSKQWTGMRS